MSSDELKQFISQHTPEAVFEEGGEFLNVVADASKLKPLALHLRRDPSADFDYLFCMTGVDWVQHFYVVYHLTSKKHRHTLVLKAKITDRVQPSLETVSDIWRTAEFHEREIYDFFGITFRHHPDMRRLFMPDDWVGHPLRKDYQDDTNIVEL